MISAIFSNQIFSTLYLRRLKPPLPKKKIKGTVLPHSLTRFARFNLIGKSLIFIFSQRIFLTLYLQRMNSPVQNTVFEFLLMEDFCLFMLQKLNRFVAIYFHPKNEWNLILKKALATEY